MRVADMVTSSIFVCAVLALGLSSDIDAPLLAKGAIWSATATDNTFNVLSGSVVTEINSFIYEKCKDVGVDIPAPK